MGRLLLWDVDGTLIRGGGVGSEAINRAAAAVVGKPIAGRPVVMHGKTDPQILTELLVAAEIAEHAIPELLPAAVAETERLLALAEADLRRRGAVIGGVAEALARLATVAGVAPNPCDGKSDGERGSQACGLWLDRLLRRRGRCLRHRPSDRNELVPIALERVEQLRGECYLPGEVWVIGDTPGDLACARAAGVRCLLVATGQIPICQLEALDADAVLADLTNTDDVVQILTR